MNVYEQPAISLAEIERLVGRIFETWPPERRDACWVRAYDYASRVFMVWEGQVESEIARREARDVDACERAELAQSGTAKSSREGAACVGGGRHGPTGDSLADDICAVKIAAVDDLLQNVHAKGRRKEVDLP